MGRLLTVGFPPDQIPSYTRPCIAPAVWFTALSFSAAPSPRQWEPLFFILSGCRGKDHAVRTPLLGDVLSSDGFSVPVLCGPCRYDLLNIYRRFLYTSAPEGITDVRVASTAQPPLDDVV
ncbi:hypothetical protein CB1_000589032 [Camelus ferus]|nr:hypothetical protein CB1_000589032 [Camelus ferus]